MFKKMSESAYIFLEAIYLLAIEMTFGISRKMDMGFDETIERVQEGLMKVGFGVLTEIDIKSTMKEKLGIDYRGF